MDQDAPQMRSALLRKIYDYWSAQRHGRRIPRRSDIDPHALMLALPHVFLVDVERNAHLDFTFRLAGTFLEAAFDQTMTKKHLRDLKLDGKTAEIFSQYREAVIECRPIVSREKFVNEDDRHFAYERLLLPLSVGDDESVGMILGAICFDAPLPTPSLPFLSPAQS